ncbi:MAG: NYN domain-containing protein [Parcubacteria group bacterium]
MIKSENNFAYIDAANLHKGVQNLGWRLDYARFRIWLKEKYGVTRAYLFIGLVPKHKDLYTGLQEAGFTLIFKETTCDNSGKVKGNCDADLVLKTVVDYFEKKLDKAIIVSSDGDYACLVKFLKEKGSLRSLISPNNKCSFLLRKLNIPITYLDSQRNTLTYKPTQKEKAPDADGTALGSSSW